MENDFKIMELEKNEFVVFKKFKDKKTSGCLWWSKTYFVDSWERVTKYGQRMSCNDYIFDIQIFELVEYKTLKEAQEFVNNIDKYPKTHKLTS